MTTPPALHLSRVSVQFGEHRVLEDLDLELRPGTVLGLLGANGAGKSTLIAAATGLLRPDAGRVLIGGLDASRHRLDTARQIGLAPQRLGIYPSLTAQQNLMIFAELAGLRGRGARIRTEQVLTALDLGRQADRIAGELSGGQQRRVHTGMALVGRPRLIFLDEPTVGADLASRRRILQTVRELAAGGTAVLYTSHVLSEFEELDAEIAVLHDGRITARGSIPELLGTHAQSSVVLSFTRPIAPLEDWRAEDDRTLVHRSGGMPGPIISQAMAELGARPEGLSHLADVRVQRPGLEEVFLRLTGSRWSPDQPSTIHGAPPEAERSAS